MRTTRRRYPTRNARRRPRHPRRRCSSMPSIVCCYWIRRQPQGRGRGHRRRRRRRRRSLAVDPSRPLTAAAVVAPPPPRRLRNAPVVPLDLRARRCAPLAALLQRRWRRPSSCRRWWTCWTCALRRRTTPQLGSPRRCTRRARRIRSMRWAAARSTGASRRRAYRRCAGGPARGGLRTSAGCECAGHYGCTCAATTAYTPCVCACLQIPECYPGWRLRRARLGAPAGQVRAPRGIMSGVVCVCVCVCRRARAHASTHAFVVVVCAPMCGRVH
jgi:hypothetical protein